MAACDVGKSKIVTGDLKVAILAEKLSKSFSAGTSLLDLVRRRPAQKRRTLALDAVDLVVNQGEILALLGPNGAGKTTLIKILCCLILPDAGEANVAGFDIVREPDKAKSSISLVIGEERSFYWRLTGRQNLEFFAALYDLTVSEARRRIEDTASLLGLDDLDRRYQEYSTGMKQRLALARSFLSNAEVIFMDEPTRSLDPNAAATLRDLIRRHLRDGRRAIVFTTHQTKEAEELADRIAILDRGRIRASGTLAELRRLVGNPAASLEEIFRKLTQDDGE